MLAILAVAWMSLVAVLLFRAVTQYRACENIPPRPWINHRAAPRVSVIVPARNASQTLGKCLRSLLAQDYPNLEIVVVDDNSTDGTGEIADRFSHLDSRVRVIHGRAVPQGWTGKPHACWLGAAVAQGRWLCFIDANTVTARSLLSAAITLARRRKLDFLSLEPFQVLGTFWERLIIPAGMFLMTLSQDLRHINDPNHPDAAANGQFILIRRAVYQGFCGHSAVRAEICEATALARIVKPAGKRIALLGAENIISARMYTGLKPIWEGLSKNAVELAGGSPATLALAALALTIASASIAFPLLATQAYCAASVITASDVAVCEGTIASVALFAMHIAVARHFRIPWWFGLLSPLGYAAAAAIALHSFALSVTSRSR